MLAPHLTNVEQVRAVQKKHRKGTTESLMLTVEVQYIVSSIFMIVLICVFKVFEKGGLLLYRTASCVQGMLQNLTKTDDFLVHVTKL